METYAMHCNVTDDVHKAFDKECENPDMTDFRNNDRMKGVVHNCSFESGSSQLDFLKRTYPEILSQLDKNKLIQIDSIGGNRTNLIEGLTPKVYSYIREAIVYCKYYLEPRNVRTISNLLMIGPGYGMECCIMYMVTQLMGITVNKITGLDMPNLSALQNNYFQLADLSHICRSYSYENCDTQPDFVYSNCCLAEVPCDVNFKYYNSFCRDSKGIYIVWGTWAAEIPQYYQPYVNHGEASKLLNMDLAPGTNALIMK